MSSEDIPNNLVRPPVREVMSARVRPELKQALDAFVTELQAHGWTGLQKHHVLEYLMRDLLTEEGRSRVREDLADLHR
ncbi:hypothetical protein DAETH_47900 (plasmid) [Deinococcus aetherius]|uniref:Uncharacterized protein n=1 Tax=Deinococcus aetherius TaxID=200252 RepID=A0ABN6RNE7_9DEIO|nr:hypothetical protein [Deinococcus aetherius]BDP44821.1 hypothetical protein DAETH_47900 [Deinococcus aetherius]